MPLGTSATEAEILANAQYMKEHLLAHGWRYIVSDARWYDAVSSYDDRDFNKERSGAKLAADEFGRMLPSPNRFPSAAGGQGFKPLGDKLHEMGLKFGFQMMRGIPRVSVPTLFVWGTLDPAISREAAEGCAQYVNGPYRFEVLDGVGHWIPEVEAELLNALLLEHLASY